ncbi:uncharacterized protein LOC124936703 isoform X2 [Impatiens glandulifera]|uniref:uncharacterized protein LOC124936703 isoform X2 n=1 Tax=Impatiens glandulifera TaxID=253017 RepID=UPI001FB15C02|nr:uncharacterized protein LOC124936703 isoform X2 [Impatiens glandulifera]
MGFDYECIVDVSQLAGEYFCPVCSQLVYPDEALKTQCSHLFCKPCLTYTVSTSQACPYDGFLVTEADSKPLKESDKALAETIGKIPVTCLYNRSGCPWKGNLSECSSHCGTCAFGSSPVVCNRCGVQIVHRQVQEHVQNCPVQQAATVVSTSAVQSQTTNAPAATTQVAGGPPSQDVNQQAIATSQVQAVTSTIPQNQGQYYQQHQQYYQQQPGYDLYQQQYQYYHAYQQPTVQQFQQHPPVGQGQHPPVGQGQHPPVGQGQHQPVGQGQHPPVGQGQHPPVGQGQHPPAGQGQHPPAGQGQQPVQVYPHPQQQSQVQAHPQIQLPTQPQPQIQTHHPQPQQLLHAQAPVTGQNQNQAAVNPPQQQYLAAGQPPFQMQAPVQAQSHGPYPGQQQRPQQPMPQYHQQSHSQVQHPPTQIQPPFQQQQPLPQPPQQPQIQPPFQAGPQYVNPPPPFHAVSGHQSYGQPQAHQHMQVAPQQVNPQNAFPQHPPNQYYGQLQHPPQMKSNVQLPSQLPPTVLPAQGPAPSFPPTQQLPMYGHAQQLGYPSNHRPALQPPHQSMPPHSIQSQQTFQGQPAVPVQNQLYPSAPFVQQQQQMRPPHSLPTAPHQSVAPQNMTQQSQNYNARPTVPSHGVQPQPSAQSPAVFTSAGQDRPMQPFMNQAPLNQNDTLRRHNQLLKSSEQQIAQSVDVISNSGPSVETTVISNQGTYGLSSDGRHQNKDMDTDSNPKAKGTGTLLPENGSTLPDSSIKSVSAKKVDGVIETSGDGGAVDTSLEVKTKNMVNSEVSRSEFEDGSKAVSQDQGQGHVGEDVKIFPAPNEKQGKTFPNPTNQIPVTEQGRDPSYPLHLSNSGQHQRHPGSSMFPLVQSQNVTKPQGPEQMHLKGMQLVPPERFPAGLPEGSFELTAIGMGKGSYISQPHPNHPGEAGHFNNLKSSTLDGRKPDSHPFATSNMGPYGEPSELMSARGKREQGSDPPFNIEDGLNRFPVDPARQHDRVSRPPYKLDAPREAHDRVRPLGPDGNTGRLDPAFLAPTSEYPRHHMDRLDPRSPGREYLDFHSRNPHLHRNQPRLDDINGWESHHFNDASRGLNFSSDPIRHPFSQDRLPQRGEVDVPGNFRGGDLTRPEMLPPHLRKGDPFSSGNFHGHFPLPEPGFGSYGDPRMGDFSGPGNLHHRPRIGESLGENLFGQPRIGEPGFRSSYSSSASLDSIERRRPPGIYCRICDVVCESLEALDMHAHTKDHQKMSLNVVANIKRNAKKRKATNLSSLGARSHRDI